MQCENKNLKIILEKWVKRINGEIIVISNQDFVEIKEAAERMADQISELEEQKKTLITIDDGRLKIQKKLENEISVLEAKNKIMKDIMGLATAVLARKNEQLEKFIDGMKNAENPVNYELLKKIEQLEMLVKTQAAIIDLKNKTSNDIDNTATAALLRHKDAATDKMTPELLAKLKKMAINDQPGFVVEVTPEEMDYIHKVVKEEGFFSFGRL